MTPRPLAIASVVLATCFAVAAPASAGDPTTTEEGRSYLAQDLPALVEGLGYDARALPDGTVVFDVIRGENFRVEISLKLSPSGTKLQLFAPLYRWPKLDVVTSPVLTGLLAKNIEIGPARFYLIDPASVDGSKGAAWVGLLCSVDNRAVRPVQVRQQIDSLYFHARATESLWNPEKWPTEPKPGGGPEKPH